MADFKSRLKELRKEAGLKQDDLAKALGVTYGAVSSWERGIRKPDYEMMNAICSYFNTTLNYLFGDDVGRYPTDPDYENLANWAVEDMLVQATSFARMFVQLSEASKRIVMSTVAAAYKEDKVREVLQQEFDVEVRVKTDAD